MRTLRSLAPLLLLLLALAAGLAALHRVGEAEWAALPTAGSVAGWLAATPAQDAVMALVRLLALLAGWWVLAASAAYVAVAAVRAERGRAALGALTPPGVRRLADQALALVVATGLAVGSGAPALAAPPPPSQGGPAVVEELQRVPQPGGLNGAQEPPFAQPVHGEDPIAPQPPPSSVGEREPAPSPAPEPPARDDPDEAIDPAAPPVEDAGTEEDAGADATRVDRDADEGDPATVTVVPGDHLWGLTAAHLAASQGRAAGDLSPAEIVGPWHEVVERNADRLRSGDPDLIHPGEVIELPPLD